MNRTASSLLPYGLPLQINLKGAFSAPCSPLAPPLTSDPNHSNPNRYLDPSQIRNRDPNLQLRQVDKPPPAPYEEEDVRNAFRSSLQARGKVHTHF